MTPAERAEWVPTVGAKYLDIKRPRWVEVEVTEVSSMCAQLGDDGRFVLTCFDPEHEDYRFQRNELS